MKRLGGKAETGRKMRQWRASLGLTRAQVEVGTLALAREFGRRDLHVSELCLLHIENGHFVASVVKLQALASVYQQRPEELLDVYKALWVQENESDLHVGDQYLLHLEAGHFAPSVLKLLSLAKVYELRPEEVLDAYNVLRPRK